MEEEILTGEEIIIPEEEFEAAESTIPGEDLNADMREEGDVDAD